MSCNAGVQHLMRLTAVHWQGRHAWTSIQLWWFEVGCQHLICHLVQILAWHSLKPVFDGTKQPGRDWVSLHARV